MKKLLVLVLIGFVLTSCKKYEEGGLVSKTEKRLTNNSWVLEQYLRNDVDETAQLIISSYTETYTEGGVLTRSYVDEKGDLITQEGGGWTLDKEGLLLKIDGVGSVELTNQTSTVSSSEFNILRVKKKEYWYYYENGGDTHEFHFKPL